MRFWSKHIYVQMHGVFQMLKISVEKLHSTIQQAPTITEWINLSTTQDQHITENILLNLDFKNLKVCQSANIKFEQILANPIFWLKSPGL